MNRQEELRNCLISVANQTCIPDEVVVIDASREARRSDTVGEPLLGSIAPKVVRAPGVSLTKARNIGISASSGDYIAFLDDDVIIHETYMENILLALTRDSRIGAATGKIEKPVGANRHIGKNLMNGAGDAISFLFFLYSRHNGKFRRSGWPTTPRESHQTQPIECLSGSNMVFRRQALESEAFDEHLLGFSPMEDCDISWRISRRWVMMYVPAARLEHIVSPVSRSGSHDRRRLQIVYHNYLFKKNFRVDTRSSVAYAISLIGMIVSCLIRGDLDGTKGTLRGIADCRIPPSMHVDDH